MIAKVKFTGEIVDVFSVQRLTTAGLEIRYYEFRPDITNQRSWSEDELEFNEPKQNSKEQESFETFDWQAFGREFVKDRLIHRTTDWEIKPFDVRNEIENAKTVISELRKTIF